MVEMLLMFAAIMLFGVLHTLLAGRVKPWFRRRFGTRTYEGLYRILFNLLAVITVAPVGLLMMLRPGPVIWSLDDAWLPLLLPIQGLALVGFALSLLQVDLMRFAGLSQLKAYLTDEQLPLPPEPMQMGGVYALVRHPLYLFSLMLTWPVQTMTGAYLGFCVGMTLYFVVGSRLEERRLADAFGAQYEAYQARVPWLFPLPRPNRGSMGA